MAQRICDGGLVACPHSDQCAGWECRRFRPDLRQADVRGSRKTQSLEEIKAEARRLQDESKEFLAHIDAQAAVPDLRQADVRGSTHGDFGDNAMFALQMRDLLRSIKPHWSNLTAEQRLALDEIALKIARILSGGADVAEHWIDIQGYAKLGEKVCKR